MSEPAHRRLEALRSSVEVRLAALESALADPSRGDALESLILDLARVSTEEAQASAAHACVETRLEAEMLAAQGRAAAQAAIDQEHAASAEVRRALENARERIAALERDREDDLQASRDSFNAELTKERALGAELERTVAKLERSLAVSREELDTEQATSRELRHEADRIDGQLAALKQQYASAMDSQARTESEMNRLREALAESERSHEETHTQLAIERNALSDLRSSATKSADELTALGRRESDARAAHDEVVSDLTRERQAHAELKRAYSDLKTEFEAARSAGAEGSQAIAQAEKRMQAAVEAAHDAEARAKQAADKGTHAEARAVAAEEAVARAHERMKAAEEAAARADTRLKAALEAERVASEKLREARTQADGWTSKASDHVSQPDALHRRLEEDLDSERQAHADLRKAHAELQARWDAERSASAELRHQATSAEDRVQGSLQEMRDALAHSRAEVQTLRDDLETARGKVESLLGERADFERSLKEAEARAKRATRDREDLEAQLQSSHEPAPTHAKPGPQHTPLHVLPAPAYKVPHRHGTKSAGKPKEAENSWVALRLATRYAFSEPITVQINGVAGRLCDLSTGGCQVLSSTLLKPNHTVKVLLPADPKSIVCTGKIVWAKLEAPALGRPAGYRAGVQFARADTSAIEAFIKNQGANAVAG